MTNKELIKREIPNARKLYRILPQLLLKFPELLSAPQQTAVKTAKNGSSKHKTAAVARW